jgi:hypothetical protein
MPRRGGRAHVATIKTRGKNGAVYTSYLLRRSYRDGGSVRHENLGNLSHLPLEIIEAIRKMLAGRVLVDLDEQFEIDRSLPHGHVAAVLSVLRELDLERLLSRERCRERDLAVAMICQLTIGSCSKLSMTRRFWPEHALRRARAGRGLRGRAARCAGLAARPPAADREDARAPAPHRRRVRAL